MSRIGVSSERAPTLRPGVYSPAIIANGFVFTSGVLGADPVTKKIIDGSVIDRFVRISSFSLFLHARLRYGEAITVHVMVRSGWRLLTDHWT